MPSRGHLARGFMFQPPIAEDLSVGPAQVGRDVPLGIVFCSILSLFIAPSEKLAGYHRVCIAGVSCQMEKLLPRPPPSLRDLRPNRSA